MRKFILTDCDGVLCNWNTAFESFMTDCGYKRVPGTDNEYSLAARFGIPFQVAFSKVKEFNESKYIANLEPLADSVEYVTKLAQKGFRFTVVTSISDAPLAKVFRTLNLKELFGDVFDEIVCLKSGASKEYELKRWADSGYFWIEDHMRQAEAGLEAGLRPILVDHAYNSHYQTDLFPRVSSSSPWKEIYNMICEDYNIEK